MLVTGIIGREAERADAYVESKWSSTFAKAFAVQVLVTTYGLELCTSLPACIFISSHPDFRTCMSSLNTSYDERFCSPRTTNGAWPDVDWHEFRHGAPTVLTCDDGGWGDFISLRQAYEATASKWEVQRRDGLQCISLHHAEFGRFGILMQWSNEHGHEHDATRSLLPT